MVANTFASLGPLFKKMYAKGPEEKKALNAALSKSKPKKFSKLKEILRK